MWIQTFELNRENLEEFYQKFFNNLLDVMELIEQENFSKLQEEAQLTYNSLNEFPTKLMRNSLGFQYDDVLELVMAVLKLTNSVKTLDIRNNHITTKTLGLIKDLIVMIKILKLKN